MHRRIRRRPNRARFLVLATITALVIVLTTGLASAATVTGPVTGGGGAIVPPSLGLLDLSQFGYSSAEYFLSGTASAYSPTPPGPLANDGKWTVTASSTAPYTTRVVAYTPSADRFNGTVVVEWLNVSGGVDGNPDWTMTHNELIREGAAWVGVSAQAVGLNQLKCPTTLPTPPVLPCLVAPGDPVRYASLSHPGDSYSYDIFSQAGQAIVENSSILGGLTPTTLLAVGESQSASRMVTYINAVHPLAQVYDGFLVHSRGGAGSALSQAPLAAVTAPNPTFIRTDLTVPVFVLQTETDVAGALAARQADSNLFRQWEVAGTSHFDIYGLLIGPTDTGDGQGAVANLAAMQNPSKSPGPGAECTLPMNTGGAHWTLNAAIFWLNEWATKGTLPPSAPPLQVASSSPFAYAKDANGNVLGGVRTPHVDAPIAALGGFGNTAAAGNTSPISQFCRLFGSTVPFTPEQLAALYTNKGQFVSAWGQATKNLVKQGFILKADENELTQSAVHSQIGK